MKSDTLRDWSGQLDIFVILNSFFKFFISRWKILRLLSIIKDLDCFSNSSVSPHIYLNSRKANDFRYRLFLGRITYSSIEINNRLSLFVSSALGLFCSRIQLICQFSPLFFQYQVYFGLYTYRYREELFSDLGRKKGKLFFNIPM